MKTRFALWMVVLAQLCMFAHAMIPHHHHDGVVTVCLHHHGIGNDEGGEADDDHCCSFQDLQYVAEEDHHNTDCPTADIVPENNLADIPPLHQVVLFPEGTFLYSAPPRNSFILRGPPAC